MNIAENIDCLKAMKNLPDKAFDLAVVDPPYFSGPERRGYYGRKVSKIGVHRDYPISPKWDIPTREYFDELERVAKRRGEGRLHMPELRVAEQGGLTDG